VGVKAAGRRWGGLGHRTFREERGSMHGGGRCWRLAGGGGATCSRRGVCACEATVSCRMVSS
jgi:hypothetical protein